MTLCPAPPLENYSAAIKFCTYRQICPIIRHLKIFNEANCNIYYKSCFDNMINIKMIKFLSTILVDNLIQKVTCQTCESLLKLNHLRKK